MKVIIRKMVKIFTEARPYTLSGK